MGNAPCCNPTRASFEAETTMAVEGETVLDRMQQEKIRAKLMSQRADEVHQRQHEEIIRVLDKFESSSAERRSSFLNALSPAQRQEFLRLYDEKRRRP
ncbi:hypothetical protein GUITHDRAFT_108523 [Guillardia theta CCMP2712]|uniref:Uncharacterized protein n=1 Tax=Guillardia theta (strain CCMP2712) TaxID=905079 RepID=L1JAT9_GUITC|nr:hypothetical protein GUITHDRAFT_108523 [Guillardia theta CCMP2712]EKX45646.1 hypothetical protein GUITHDRAFT_108523 [Guillardia theta CCMP2712]|eukprot:XP_005832626.1 hypothetical protein GUITHDRAFT_108523 [Guillardia theta CCMP2712]